MFMRILVTGGAGFIGSHVAEKLLEQENEVVILDNFNNYYSADLKRKNLEKIKDRITLLEADILEMERVKEAVKNCDSIIHEAAQAGVRISVKQPLKTSRINITGTLNVLQAAKEEGIKKVVFASSSSVYGKIHHLPFDEDHPKEPISPYGVSKLAGEHYCRVFSELYGLEIPMLRYFTVYGPRIRPDLAINKFMHNAMKNQPLEIYGDGKKSRDFTYISDIVEGTILALNKGKTTPYNLGGGNKVTVLELAQKIKEITNSSSELVFSGDVQGDVQHTSSNTEKAKKELGWQPKVHIDDGLRKYYEWVKEEKYE